MSFYRVSGSGRVRHVWRRAKLFVFTLSLLLVVFSAGMAAAAAPGDILSISASPTTFTAAGQNITFTYSFQPQVGLFTTGARLTQSTVFGATTLNCPTQVGTLGLVPLVCTATHVTTSGDVAAGAIQELAKGDIQVFNGLTSNYESGTSGTVAANLVNLQLAAQTITFPNPGLQLLATLGINLTATSSSGLPVSYVSADVNVCVVLNGVVTFVNTGLCVITASQAGNGTYAAAANVQQSFSIIQSNQTITFGAIADRAMGSPPFTVSATASSGQAVTFSSDTTSICAVSGTTVTLLQQGTCTVRASQSGNLFYSPATPVTQTFNITAPATQGQVITFPAIADHTYGGPAFTISASATSGLAVSFASQTASVCSVSGNQVTLLALGTCTITASQPGNGTYSAAADVSQSFTSTLSVLLPQTIAFNALPDKLLGDPAFAVSATSSSTLTVTIASDTTSVCTVSGTQVTLVAAGTCTLRASQPGNLLYAAAAEVTQSFAVNTPAPVQQSQTISFAPLSDRAFSGAAFTVSATASSNLAVSFASTTPSTCSVSGNQVTMDAVGTCTIVASQGGDANFTAAADVAQSFTITPSVGLSQTITFNSVPNQTLGTAPFPVSATASSGLTVSIASDTPSICLVSAGQVNLVAAGSCSLRASQSGDVVYAAAQDVVQTFTVSNPTQTQQSQTITFGPISDHTYPGTPFTLSASASSSLQVTFASVTLSVCSVSGNVVTLNDVGTCTIVASQSGDALYAAAADVVQSFNSNLSAGLPQTITFASVPDQTLSATPIVLSASASSNLPVTIGSDTPSVCTASGTVANMVTTGTCTLRASQSGSVVYASAQDVVHSFVINSAAPVRQNQTITFAPLPDRAYGTAPFALAATASSNLPVNFDSATPLVCSVNANVVTLLGLGTCTINAAQPGDANYAAAPDVSQSFYSVASLAQSQTITFASVPDHTYGDAPFNLTATASSGLPITFVSDTASVCSVNGSTVTLLDIGTCIIRATQGGDLVYAGAPDVSRSFGSNHPSPRAQAVTFSPLSNRAYGSAPFNVAATSTSGLPVSFASSTPSVCTVNGDTVTLVGVGTCTITASQVGDGTYAAAPAVSQSFSSTAPSAQPQTISFGSFPDQEYGDPPFTATASSSSGLPVTFSSDTPSVCTLNGDVVTVIGVGTCTIRGSQAGNASYASTSATRSFQVHRDSTEMTFTITPDPPILGKPVQLAVTFEDGTATGTVTYWDGSTELGVVTLSNGVAEMTYAPTSQGAHTYAAQYSGDAHHAPRTTTRNFSVQPRSNPAVDPKIEEQVSGQLDEQDMYVDGQDRNMDGHLANLHMGKRRGVSTEITLNGVPLHALIEPTADDISAPPLRLWAVGDLEVGQKDGAYRTDFATTGFTLGLETQLTDKLTFGIAAGFGWDDTHIGTDGTRNFSNSQSIMAYADYAFTPSTFLDVTGGIALGEITADRYSDDAGEILSGNRNAKILFGSVKLTHQQRYGQFTLAPYGEVKGRLFVGDAYSEDGNSSWRLSYSDIFTARLKAAIGATMTADIPVSWGGLNARVRAEYGMQVASGYSQMVGFVDDPDASGGLSKGTTLSQRGMVGFGLGFANKAWTGSLDYSYATNFSDTRSHIIEATLGKKF